MRRECAVRFVIGIVCVVTLATQICAQGYPSVASYYQNSVTGKATEYNTWQPGGGCGYWQNPPPGYQVFTTVGTSSAYFGNGELCGMCIEVTRITPETGNPVPFDTPVPYKVLLTNHGPTDSPYWLDHSVMTVKGGRFSVDYHAVPCPVTQPIQWQLMVNSQRWYLQLIPVYNSIVIGQLCLNVGGTWQPMSRVGGGNGLWAFGGQEIPDNPQIKAISIDGQVIVDSIAVSFASPVPATAIYGGFSPSQFGPINYANLGAPLSCAAGLTPVINITIGDKNGDKRPPYQSIPPVAAGSAPTTSSSDDSLSSADVAGIAIGSFFAGVVVVLVVAIIIAAVVVIVYRRRHVTQIPPNSYVQMELM